MWRAGGRDYIVTNWHVFSMRNFFAPERNLNPNGGRPNRLRAIFNVSTGSFARWPLDLIIRDEDDRPLWLVHPIRNVDVAILPTPIVANGLPAYPINELANAKLRIAVGMEVFILGYPFKIELPGYPVWKRGSIASEPQLSSFMSALGSDVRNIDYILVDTASRPGMSGAPVIRRSWSNHDLEPNFIATVDTPIDRFLGVYSGRARTDRPDEAQIGLVWNASLIEEIIVGNRRDVD
jgi:Trypsin-like peptidase domain